MDQEYEASGRPEIATEEIAAERWPDFARDLSRSYIGWRVWIEVLGTDSGDQPVLEGLPLQGVSFETAGSAEGAILIEVGDEPDFFIHQVARPSALRVAHMRPGELIFMQLESSDGGVTLVRLQKVLELPAGNSPRRPSFGRARSDAGAPKRPRGGKEIERTGRAPRQVGVGMGALVVLAGIGALLLITRGPRRRRALRAC